MPSIVIIAAMKQEILPLLEDRSFAWKPNKRITAGFGAWENDRAALICSGIGAKPGIAAAEQSVREFSPRLIVSAGAAGALVPGFSVGTILHPATVVSSSTGERYQVLGGTGVLVTASGVAGIEGKRLLAHHFNAEAADMEGAHVAGVAQRHGILFAAIKSISDEYDFEMPDLNPFITTDGRFQTRRFALFMATRPRLWPVVRQLARNSKQAAVELCRELRNLILQDTNTSQSHQLRRPTEPQPAK